jgi:hypothetical protein
MIVRDVVFCAVRVVSEESLRVYLIPPNVAKQRLVNTSPRQRIIVGGVVFCAVRVVSKERRYGSQVPSCYCMLLMQPFPLKFIKITLPCC